MIARHMIALWSLTALCGCSSASPEHVGEDTSQKIEIEVVTAEEHLGHNIDESGGHSVWCDGCKARVVPSGEPFVIYWINDAIDNSNFRFNTEQKYQVLFAGEVGTGVMAYEGMCIDLQQILKLEEE